ncbi:MAG: pilus assembly protein PilM [Chromatiaceae bacterium]|nr:pilus assembly protein PilM [Chromatiaceae bacterium]
MFGLKRGHSPLIGIDIGSTAVKQLELARGAGKSGYRVEHFAIEPLPLNAMSEKKIADGEAVGLAIGRALQRSASKARRAAVAVAGSAVITKTIAMPSGLSDSELEAQIELEADQYVPYPLEEVSIDFNVLGPSENNPGMVDVLLAASRRENVDDRVGALEIAGLTAAVVDIEAYAMENATNLLLEILREAESVEANTVAVVDIGSTSTTLHVLHEGRIVYTREQNFGGQQLKDEVQRRYGFSREQATQRIRDGDVADGYEGTVLTPFKEALAQQVGRGLQFFYSGSSFSKVDLILLAGGPASLPKLDQLVTERIRVPTLVANPFTHMAIASGLNSQELMREAPGMMVALGLALRGFD